MNILRNDEFLINIIDDKDTIIFDCRFDMNDVLYGINSYNESHIKHAFYMDLNKDLAGEVKLHGGRHPLPDLDEFVAKLESFNVDYNKNIIIYDDGELAMAGRLFILLKYLSFENVYVLEGGFNRFKEKYPDFITDEKSISDKKSNFDYKLNKELIVDMEYVKSKIDINNTVIVDSRSEERYLGIEEPIDIKKGHIKSAVNVFWGDLIIDGKLKSKEELNKIYEAVKGKEEIIIHCGSGVTASVNFIAMLSLNMDPRIYLGSFSDWISYDDNEVISV
ncbi:sulfurtransferase [Peptostreptococcaceae bacterium AGR-M142]